MAANGVDVYRWGLNEKLSKAKTTGYAIEEEKKRLQQAEDLEKAALEGQNFLQNIAQEVQAGAQKQISRTVSKCLAAVFTAKPYELRIVFERKRGKTEAEFLYFRDGHLQSPKQTSGAARSIAGMALRLSSMTIAQPPCTRFIALDEPFQGLSSVNLEKMGVLLETLARELGVQFLISTHDPELRIGNVVELPDLAPRKVVLDTES